MFFLKNNKGRELIRLIRKQLFTEVLDGTTVKELHQKLDVSIKNLEDRLDLVEGILDDTTFFQEYFDEYYNSNPNNSDFLSADNNVCQLLESMSTYILNSEEIQKENKSNEIEYKFITDNGYFEKKLKRENHMKADFNNGDTSAEIIPFVKRDSNYLKTKEQKVYNKDIQDKGEMGYILKQYAKFIAMAQEERKNANSLTTRNYYICRFICEGRLDMKLVKDCYRGTIYFKNPSKGCVDCSKIEHVDFTKPEIVDLLMTVSEKVTEINDFSIIVMSFNQLIEDCPFTEYEREVLNYYRNGYNKKEIGEEVGVSRPAIFKTIQKIRNKIIKHVKQKF